MNYNVVKSLRRIATAAAIPFAICMALAATSYSQSYKFKTIDVPGATNTFAMGINNAGQIVGYYSYPPKDPNGHEAENVFVLSGGNFSTFGYPGSYYTAGYGINNSGQIVGTCEVEFYGTFGTCQDFYGVVEGWVDADGSFTTVSFPGAIANATSANGINDSGQVVGQYELPSGNLYGYLLSAGSYTTVSPTGATGSGAQGINNAGHIVGSDCSGSCNQVSGFLESGGNFTTIAVPGAVRTYAIGINNSDDVVGQYANNVSGPFQAFLWSDGQFELLSDPHGAARTSAAGINDAGQIVGFYVDAKGVSHGFVATPVKGAATVTLTSTPNPS